MYTDISYDEQVWDMILQIFNNCKGKTIKGISVKKSLIHSGGKYKWQDGMALHFSFEDKSFSCTYVDYFEDTNDYKQKSLITNTEYSINKLTNIKRDEVLPLLKSKSRIIKIEKLLKENS
jgi:disulfide oxidoreductase YuzD